MAPSRKPTANGRSPLVNKKYKITSFFPRLQKSNPESSSPTTPNPGLITGAQKASMGISDDETGVRNELEDKEVEKRVGEDVINRRIRVFCGAEKTWYEGCVKGYDKYFRKHLVEYDNDNDNVDDDMVDINKEKFEWVESSVGRRKYRRLRKASMVVSDDEDDNETENISGVKAVEGARGAWSNYHADWTLDDLLGAEQTETEKAGRSKRNRVEAK